ncbi:MAG: hypothetical protein IT168_04060 [Bryobacterales bacterium]|nr:hypothetical protein [Bryobacterales bacterium]
MKKSWVPLLVIALGVAVVATLVFYGLVVSGLSGVEAKAERIAIPAGGPDTSLKVPSGLRAISIHVVDSDGLLKLMTPHSRVDVQAIYGPPDRLELRTIVQNVEVLAVTAGPERVPGRGPAPVVTLATTPSNAEIVGLADTATKLRLTLRNPGDLDGFPRPSVGMGAITNFEVPRMVAASPAEPAIVPQARTTASPATPIQAHTSSPACKTCVRP